MNRRNWKVLAPMALTALAALAAGVSVLLQKTEEGASAPAAKPAAKAAGPVRDPVTVSLGTYSFISGFQNAATVELTIPFDPESEGFSVVSEDYLSASDDSHVALLFGGDYNLQIEYGAYYGGEGWQAHCAALREKHADLREVCFGENSGVLFLDGDVLRVDLPVPDDSSSFVQITVQKTSAFDGTVTELAGHPALCEQLAGITFNRS